MNESIEKAVTEILKAIGEDPKREGLKNTPARVGRAWRDLTRGYQQDAEQILKKAIFKENYDEMVLVKDIEFFSLCEHHLLPFFGRCHIAYIPSGKIVGLSKMARVTDVFARRLQVQERLTEQIADAIQGALKPRGVAVVMEAKHMCMVMRGVEKQNSVMVTSALRGEFRKNSATRAELMKLLRLQR
jgi:GTP cyclohydrolase I